MRKQNRPNQTARKQMQNLTVELFARDKNTRRQLIDNALASVSPVDSTTSPTVSPTGSPVTEPTTEPIPELVQILLSAEPGELPRRPRTSRSTCSAESKQSLIGSEDKKSEPPLSEISPSEASTPISSESQPGSQQSMTAEEALTCAQIIAEEERLEAEEKKAKEEAAATPKAQEPPEVLPPPIQRVSVELPSLILANIRSIAESLNISAVPAQTEPMSFAACVRKMPSVETMSMSPSPYASKFDGKSNPFNTGSGPGGFGGGLGGGGAFNRENRMNGNTNPFANANRNRFSTPFDRDPSSPNPRFNNNDRDFSDAGGFSSMISLSKPNSLNRGIPRSSESSSSSMLPSWWKARSFTSASSFYPQSQRSAPFSSPTKAMTVPSQGHVEEFDGFQTANSASSAYYNRRNDLNLKKECWARMKAKKRMLRRPVEDEFYEDMDADEEILRGNGVMLNQIVQQNTSGNYEDADLLRKYRRDVAFVKEQVMNEIEGNVDGIRDLRFLLASVQTYGNIDGECMMAELAMNEFSLFSGIIEKYHAIVGPWQTENEAQRRRASRHSFETHKIPLQHTLATVPKKKLIEEILGRVEPSIACRQGVKVGLYGENCDSKSKVELNIKNNFKDAGMLSDRNERRFILVLQSELELMVESMKHLAENVELHYDGFPTHQNRYVIVEAFVEAIAEIMGEKVDVETMRWFSLLGQKVEAADSVSPWEENTDFHCSRHSEPKSNFCASVTVGRACCIIYHVLGAFFRRYHLKKIPTAQMGPSRSAMSIHGGEVH